MIRIKRIVNIIVFTFVQTFFLNFCYGQASVLKLDEAIIIAQKNSYEYKVAYNKYQSSFWAFQNFRKSFLPTLSLNGTIPDYSRSITKITLPNGESSFVNQNQAFSTVNFGIRQNVGPTGGILSIGSNLNRIDVFGNNKQTNYSAVPISISYSQGTIGFNNFNWSKKIEPLRFEASKKELTNRLEQISIQTVANYFNLIAAQTQQLLSKQNLANADTLLKIAKLRFKLLTVSQSEILQLQLNVLNAQKKVREDSLNYVVAKQQLSSYLMIGDRDWKLEIPEKILFFTINFSEALEKAKSNSREVIDFRIRRLESERNMAEIKAENKLKFNLETNFGFSNRAKSLPLLFSNLANQQTFALGFSMPLIDWGYAKTQKLKAEADLEMVKSDIAQQQMQMEQEIALYVARWNLHQKNVFTAIEAKNIADKNYDLEVQRYRNGRISINDLNAAQLQKDYSNTEYIQVIKTYWDLFFSIRKLTLYDFEKHQPITIAFNN